MITLHWLYALAGAMFAAFALLSALDRSNAKRFGNASFWGLMALSLLGGDMIDRLGNKLFLPALIIPVTALLGTLLYNYTPLGGAGWIESKRETYVFLGLGVLFALGAIFAWLRPPAIAPLQEGRRLIDAIGWAAVLPQMLASLGVLFAAAGIGDAI